MTDDESYWDWFERKLKVEPRAVGGEPCRVCGDPIPASAAWQQRDRHVCSSECNAKLRRRLKAQVRRGEVEGFTPSPSYAARVAEVRSRPPQLFRTLPGAEFPYEHARFPVVGDIIERHGERTAYLPYEAAPYQHWKVEAVLEDSPRLSSANVLTTVHLESGMWSVFFINDDGTPMSLTIGTVFRPNIDEQRAHDDTSPLAGRDDLRLSSEFISDVDEEGWEYRWQADTFTPLSSLNLWTPARTALSQKRRRVGQARHSYLARRRALGDLTAVAAHVDPIEVYERDGWACQICRKPVDREVQWPNPWSATLDHIDPVTAGGVHDDGNLQTAHWYCNVVKGNSR